MEGKDAGKTVDAGRYERITARLIDALTGRGETRLAQALSRHIPRVEPSTPPSTEPRI